MSDPKSRIKDAISGYLKRQEPKVQGPKRHYEKPEKEVEKACLEWMREQGWTVNIYEAKAVWNPQAGRYISQNMKAGTADCMGHLPDGVGVIVEFKAKGKLSSFASHRNERQQNFLKQKIKDGCFVCVTDSVERLDEIFLNWNRDRKINIKDAKAYLSSMLPKRSGRSKYDKDFNMGEL